MITKLVTAMLLFVKFKPSTNLIPSYVCKQKMLQRQFMICIYFYHRYMYLWTGPSPLFLEHQFFFSCKQHFVTLYVSLDNIYTINTSKQ
jgi:hypothetical protein